MENELNENTIKEKDSMVNLVLEFTVSSVVVRIGSTNGYLFLRPRRLLYSISSFFFNVRYGDGGLGSALSFSRTKAKTCQAESYVQLERLGFTRINGDEK